MIIFVEHKKTGEVFEIFDVTYKSKTGSPSFLIYNNGQWLRVAAKCFKPLK